MILCACACACTCACACEGEWVGKREREREGVSERVRAKLYKCSIIIIINSCKADIHTHTIHTCTHAHTTHMFEYLLPLLFNCHMDHEKLRHYCTRPSTVPCSFPLINDIMIGASSRGGEWRSEEVGARSMVPGRSSWKWSWADSRAGFSKASVAVYMKI